MNPAAQAEKVARIRSLAELDGFEAQAKLRGILPEELRAIHEKRAELSPKKRKARK